MATHGLTLDQAILTAAATLLALFVLIPPATAGHYHTNCVPHGMVHGSSTNDQSWHARVIAGCGNPGAKYCAIVAGGSIQYASQVGSGQTENCNQWSHNCCHEPNGRVLVEFGSVFSAHEHSAH